MRYFHNIIIPKIFTPLFLIIVLFIISGKITTLEARTVTLHRGDIYEGKIEEKGEGSINIKVKKAVINKKNIHSIDKVDSKESKNIMMIELKDGSALIGPITVLKNGDLIIHKNEYLKEDTLIKKDLIATRKKYSFVKIQLKDGTIIIGNKTRISKNFIEVDDVLMPKREINIPKPRIKAIESDSITIDNAEKRIKKRIKEKIIEGDRIVKADTRISIFGSYFFTLGAFSRDLPGGWSANLSFEQSLHGLLFKSARSVWLPALRIDGGFLNFAESNKKVYGGKVCGGFAWSFPVFPRGRGIFFVSPLVGYCLLDVKRENHKGRHTSLLFTGNLGYRLSFGRMEYFLQGEFLYIKTSNTFMAIGASAGALIKFSW